MKRKKGIRLAAAALICASLLAGCGGGGDKDAVSVQQVSSLVTVNVSGNNRYSGIVEAQKIQKVKKSSKKKVKKCYVKEGDTVRKGEALFTYDTTSIQLELESAQLELEKMKSEISSYDTQIAELEKERQKASSDEKLSYSLEIQEAQLDKAEAQYNYQTKQKDYEKLQKSSKKTTVYAKINGIVQSVGSDSSDDEDSSSDVYISILQTGSYRVKGTISETNMRSLEEGGAVQVISRVDDSETWSGTVSEIKQDSGSDSSGNDDYDDGSSGESATKYTFYVDLDDPSGLMLGQHVYIQLGEDDSADETAEGFALSAAYLSQDEDGGWYVWKSNRKKLVKQTVTVGDYSEYDDTYMILDGLTEDDYIAFPDEGLEEGDKTVEYDASADTETGGTEDDGGYEAGDVPAMG